MSAASVLARGRAAAAAIMVDTCLVRRKTGDITDDLTGQTSPTYATIYFGPCRVQTAGGGAMGVRADAGEISLIVLRMELQLPVATSTNVRRGDEASITVSTNDADLPGRTFRIRDLMHKTHATARRLQLEEVT